MSSNSTQTLNHIVSNMPEYLEYITSRLGSNEKMNQEKSVVKTLNELLSNSKTRLSGLELLQTLILYCSYDVLSENIFNWSSYCIIHHNEDSGKEVKLNTLAIILENTKNMEVFNKKFSAEYLNATVKSCLIYRCSEEQVAGLKCLTQCMKKYPSWFGNQKQKVESYLLGCLETQSEIVAQNAAVSFMVFLETGSSGVNGINYTNNFSSHFRKMCATIQKLYDYFFDNFPEVDNSLKIDEEEYNFNGLVHTDDAKEVAKRITNCLVFLQTMIKKSFSTEKRVVLKYIIDIVNRGLSVHICITEAFGLNTSGNHCEFLKKIQIYLLSLLKILTKRYQLNLIPFSTVIENCLLNTFRRAHQCSCFTLDLTHKTSVYKTLIPWIKLSKVSNNSQFLEKLLLMILEDISINKKTILLNINGQKEKSLQGNDSKIAIMDAIFEKNCVNALDTLKHVVTTATILDRVLLKETWLLVIKTLNSLQTDDIVGPYKNINCQIKLYELFIEFLKMKYRDILPSVHLIVNLLYRGINNRNWIISQTAKQGLELLEKISHPVCPTLYVCDFEPQSHSDLLSTKWGQSKDSEKRSINESETVSEGVFSDSFAAESKLEEDESKSEKVINIISNILITTEEEDEDVEIIDSESVSEAVLTQVEDNEVSMKEDVVENELIEKEVKLKSEDNDNNKIEKEDVKVRSEDNGDNDLEDMFGTFQDVIQE